MRLSCAHVIGLLALLATVTGAADEVGYREAREALVADLAQGTWSRDAVEDKHVLDAMRKVPRHEFVPKNARPEAYEDRPMPIGYGQTISQPYIVAFMTELLHVDGDDTVLEIGTGSAYQAAVLAELVKVVYTIEIVEPLAKQAAERLKSLKYENVHVRQGDGYFGWQEKAPFDAIIVTAAATHIPPPLIEQLKPGGRMVIPVGAPLQSQTLLLVEKTDEGAVRQKSILPVSFVPFTRSSEPQPNAQR